jgi:arylsulfatase A-like enzyme
MYGGFRQLSEERTLISEVLSEAGYATGGFHSNLYLSEEFGYARGFDGFYDSREDPSLATRLRQALKRNLNTNGPLYTFLQAVYDRTEETAGVNVGSFHAPADELTDMALSWARDRSAEGPRFLWVHYMDPHHPFIPPAEHQEFSTVSRREGVRLRPKMVEEPDTITDEELGHLVDLYDDEIRYTDAEIGRLLSGIESAWGEFTTVITADHGEEFRDHGDFTHQNRFYDETMHVPLIVHEGGAGGADATRDGDRADAGAGSGRVHEEMVGLIDIAPTIARWADVDTLPSAWWGRPLQPLLAGRSEEWDREGVRGGWYDSPEEIWRLAYRTRDWKYVRDYVHDRELLFDLRADPGEHENLVEGGGTIGEGEGPEVLAEFRGVIDDYEADIESTAVDVEEVDMDEEVKERLRRLGYKE